MTINGLSYYVTLFMIVLIVVPIVIYSLKKFAYKKKYMLNINNNLTKQILENVLDDNYKKEFIEYAKDIKKFIQLMAEMKKYIGNSVYTEYFEELYLFFIYIFYKKNVEKDIIILTQDNKHEEKYYYVFNFLVYAYKEYQINIKKQNTPKGFSLLFFKLLEQIWSQYFKNLNKLERFNSFF
ncbi:hypothetical protein DEFDS_P217 (plasmid) [Deferribacter desulfuricans SSM1]|uniref:DUF4760 domain-containing protein n=1 Tax=Deferribacter desulfuricans (strain DSM 14783 / JCM 11476 / NBRC 101012 / SSM1) TaxID=639282 RepID=D3PF45_DEFDS|nr:hypothetical protein [Deferribacter desulfuricans]BAI81837.1 hypothetical protein DEFDS_P217 [Deferribacter desulfuricans SSM1]